MIGTEFDAAHFEAAGGNFQSLTFYRDALKHLDSLDFFDEMARWKPLWSGDNVIAVKGGQPLIHDYGCAEGDGTALIQIHYPMGKVVGFDLSDDAIKAARRRWPLLEFRRGDICAPKDEAFMIFSSHTIEHTDDPVEVAANLLRFCVVLVLVFPTITETQDGGHEGAVLTREWTDAFHKRFDCYISGYKTLRWDYEFSQPLVEGNNILVCRGEL